MARHSQSKRFLGLPLKHWFWLLVLVPGVPFAAGSLFIIGYSNIPWPIGDEIRIGPIRDGVDELIILVHGKGDSPSSWATGFADDLESLILNDRQQVVTVDWGDYSRDLFRGTLNGRRIGHNLGGELSGYASIKKLHLIGHSAGSFVVYGICETVKKRKKDVVIHATYLDPVSIYGGIDWGYGTRNFGSCADVSDAYIDHEDGVPGSDKPLVNPHTFDVTGLKKAAEFTASPHLWPIEYYRQSVCAKSLPYWEPDQSVLMLYPPQKHTVL